MKELTFIFNASACCLKSIIVPESFKTKGKSLDEIYDEVYHLYGSKDDTYLNMNLVGMDDFNNMQIEGEGISRIIKTNNGKTKVIK
jgi:hypothetical protein